MRVIDADALKETIAKNVYVLSDAFNSRDYGMFWTGGIEKAIDEQPTAQQWIPVSERLPEEDHWLGGSSKQFSDNVLVSIYNSDDEDEWVYVTQTIDGEWRIELPRHCKIIAWMPLPEPYKENES